MNFQNLKMIERKIQDFAAKPSQNALWLRGPPADELKN